jgi:hypothetical protein
MDQAENTSAPADTASADAAVDTTTAQSDTNVADTSATTKTATTEEVAVHPRHRVLNDLESKANEMGSFVVWQLAPLISQLRAML